jgi:uncharacterized peroxidase-related enzyme
MTLIPPLVHLVTDDEAQAQAKALFEQVKKTTGKVPKWMRVMANNEDILIGFFTMFKAIMDDAPLPRILKWKLALVISDINKCDFCVSVSEMQLKSLALSDEDMANIDSKLTEDEKVAIEYGKAATEHAYNIDPEIIKKAKEHFNDQELVELSAVVGLFNFINRFNDSLGVLPDVE